MSITAGLSAVVYAIAGLATYLAATEGHLTTAIWIGVILLVACLVLTVAGILFGAAFPRISACLMQAWALIVLIVVSATLAALIAGTVWVLTGKGKNPPPRTEEIATASTAILTAIGGFVTTSAGKLTPAWLSKKVIRHRYGGRFQRMPSDQPELDGYRAVRNEGFGARQSKYGKGGPLNGWGMRATARRLGLIREALDSLKNTHTETLSKTRGSP
jgi:hypothetical protein